MNEKDILPELLRLPASARARLATELIHSLDESDEADAAQAWREELERRLIEVKRGNVKTESWPRVRKRIQARLRSR